MISTVALRAGTVAYDVRGTGPPIVMLPSGAHDRSDYDELRRLLPEGVRSIAMDWPGHGDSPEPTQPGSPTAWADVVEEFVEHVAPEGAVVVGSSIGGFSAGRLAARRPQLVSGLVCIDAGGFDPPTGGARAFCALMGRPRFLRAIYPRFSARYMQAVSEADRRARECAIRNTRRSATLPYIAGLWAGFAGPEHDLREAAETIAAPTLVVQGKRDPVIPPAAGRRAAELIRGAGLLEVDSGHSPHTSAPEVVAEGICRLLARVPAHA
jgi:pimeloyl-ACP methyl ester carboxylesterase